MSGKAKNIIAITIAAVAIIAVVAVVVLSSIVVRPTAYAGGWLDNIANVEIYHSSAEGNLLHSGSLDSELNEGTGEYAFLEDKYTVGEMLDMTNFSLISACLQFNYSFGLSLKEKNVADNEMTGSEMATRYSEITTGAENARGYSVVIRLDVEDPAVGETITLTDEHGRTCTQNYDTVMFTIDQDSDWVRNIDVYAFRWNAVFGESGVPGEDAASQTYYTMTCGMRTAAMLDVLVGVYGYDIFPEDEEEEEEDTEDTEDTEGTEGTDDTTEGTEETA